MDTRRLARNHLAFALAPQRPPCWESLFSHRITPWHVELRPTRIGVLSDATSSPGLSIPDRGIEPAPNALGKSLGHVTIPAAVCAGPGTLQRFGELLLGGKISVATGLEGVRSQDMLDAVELLCVDVVLALSGLWLEVGHIVSHIAGEFTLPGPRAIGLPNANEERNVEHSALEDS